MASRRHRRQGPGATNPPRRRIARQHGDLRVRHRAVARSPVSAREVVQAAFFATSAAASAFTLASQVPNLFSNLFSQAALSAAFVPVFTELLTKGRKREAFRVASTLFWVILIALGALTVVWIGVAGLIVPLFTGNDIRRSSATHRGSPRVLFPVVLLLGLTGLLVGILQSYDEFTIPALAPAVWNLVILVGLVVLHSHFHGDEQGLRVRDRMAGGDRRAVRDGGLGAAADRLPARLQPRLARPARQAGAILLVPVTISIGIVNLDIFINAVLRLARVGCGAGGDQQRVSRSTCCPRASSAWRSRPCCSRPSAGMAARRDATGCADHGQRHAPDQPAADPVRGADGRAGHADHAPDLPARRRSTRVRPSSSRRRCSGSRSACPFGGREPAVDPHVLRAPAPVDPDQAGRAQHGRRRRSSASRCTSRSASPAW